MTASDLVRGIRRFVGLVQESDLSDLIFQVRLANDEIIEVTFDSACSRFVDASGTVVDADTSAIVVCRWVASGAIVEGTIGTYGSV